MSALPNRFYVFGWFDSSPGKRWMSVGHDRDHNFALFRHEGDWNDQSRHEIEERARITAEALNLYFAEETRIPEERPAVGTRVRLVCDVERYPHFIAPRGAKGTVVDVGDDGLFSVRLDDHLEGAEEWENEVHWMWPDDDPRPDIEVLSTRGVRPAA